MVAAAASAAALDALDEEGGARDLSAVESRLARRFGPPAPIPAGVDPIVVETPADVAPRRATADAGAGQGHRRVHGPSRRAADLARDLAPPGADRDHAQPDEPDFDRRRHLRRTVFPLRARLPADDRRAFVSRPFDPRRVRRRTGQAEIRRNRDGAAFSISGATMSFMSSSSPAWASAGACAAAASVAAVARRRGRSRHAGIGRPRLLAAHARQGRRRGAVHLGLGRARAPAGARARRRVAPRFHLSRASAGARRASRTGFCCLAGLGAPIYFCLVLFLAARERSRETRGPSGA